MGVWLWVWLAVCGACAYVQSDANRDFFVPGDVPGDVQSWTNKSNPFAESSAKAHSAPAAPSLGVWTPSLGVWTMQDVHVCTVVPL